MNILLWIIFGALAGWIASLIVKTNKSQGFLADLVIGIVGAFIGGFIFSFIGNAGITGFNFYSLFVAVIGAVVLLAATKAVRRA
jgi:uncharacterized membrane protein YeaQ/YmgE (transglycosylase-associated protein family)